MWGKPGGEREEEGREWGVRGAEGCWETRARDSEPPLGFTRTATSGLPAPPPPPALEQHGEEGSYPTKLWIWGVKRRQEMREQHVFHPRFSYWFISKKDSGKREKLKLREKESGMVLGKEGGRRWRPGPRWRGWQAHMQAGLPVKPRPRGDWAFEKGGFKGVEDEEA